MTYGNRMPIPEAVTAAASTGRHAAVEAADDLAAPSRASRRARPACPGGAGHPRDLAGPVVTADSVEFRFPDADHELDGVRLEVDWILGDIDPEFAWADGDWVLPDPPAGCLAAGVPADAAARGSLPVDRRPGQSAAGR